MSEEKRPDPLAALEAVFQATGGVKGMSDWAEKNPTEFYRLYTRAMPARDAARAEPLVIELGGDFDDEDSPS